MRALRRADRCRPRCLGQSLCLLCTDSGVGLGTKGRPGGFLGVRAVRPIMAFGTGGSQHAQHRRTNAEKCHLSPVPGPLSLRTTFLGCIWGAGFCRLLTAATPWLLPPVMSWDTRTLSREGDASTCDGARPGVGAQMEDTGGSPTSCVRQLIHYLSSPHSTQWGEGGEGWGNLRTVRRSAKG